MGHQAKRNSISFIHMSCMKDVDSFKSWVVNPHFTLHIKRKRRRDTFHLWVRDVICCLCDYQLSRKIELNPVALVLSNLSIKSGWALNVMTVCMTINFQGMLNWILQRSRGTSSGRKTVRNCYQYLFRDCWKAMHFNGKSSPENKSDALAFDLLCSYTVCENGECWNI